MTTWLSRAACADPNIPTSTFFPDVEAGTAVNYGPAKAICAGCPVKVACLEAGLRERHGCWGGLAPSERQRLARERAKRRRAVREEFVVVEARACGGCGECEAS